MTQNYCTVARLGETIRFGTQKLKASMKPSTTAVFNLANRAYYIEGQAFKGDYSVGDEFTRDCELNSTYFVATIVTEPLASDLVYLFGIRSNATVKIERNTGKQPDEYGDLKDTFETVYENVPIYRDFTTRSGKITNDGTLDQTIYTMIVPHKYLISEKDRITMKCNVGGTYTDKEFYVDSVGNALADGNSEGIDTLQLSLDLRSD